LCLFPSFLLLGRKNRFQQEKDPLGGKKDHHEEQNVEEKEIVSHREKPVNALKTKRGKILKILSEIFQCDRKEKNFERVLGPRRIRYLGIKLHAWVRNDVPWCK
jgi:hypothetical protein